MEPNPSMISEIMIRIIRQLESGLTSFVLLDTTGEVNGHRFLHVRLEHIKSACEYHVVYADISRDDDPKRTIIDSLSASHAPRSGQTDNDAVKSAYSLKRSFGSLIESLGEKPVLFLLENGALLSQPQNAQVEAELRTVLDTLQPHVCSIFTSSNEAETLALMRNPKAPFYLFGSIIKSRSLDAQKNWTP